MSIYQFRRSTAILLLLLLAMAGRLPAQIQGVEYPPKPDQRGFISDNADLLTDGQEASMRAELDKLLSEKAIPIIVVTIDSMAKYKAGGMRIEMYARLLFDTWGIGHEKVKIKGRGMGRTAEIPWNKGILLLVSVGDRKARIELGADYGMTKNSLCAEIMQSHIIPRFKAGDFAGGIQAGVKALEEMARGETISPPPRPWWHYALIFGGACLAIFTFASMLRRGSSGWAWLFWGLVFSVVGMLIYQILTSRGSSSGGGSFSGGSFGGGFSGGGGATGSW